MTLEAHTHFLNVETPEGPRRIAWECWHAHGMEQAPVLICVHGLTRNRHDFDLIAKAMSDHYRVVTVDILGRGDSDRLTAPEHYGYPLYISQMLQLLKHIAEATGEQRFDWLGTSMGGLIGMMLAAREESPIRRLVLNDVGPVIPGAALGRIGARVGEDPRFKNLQEAAEYFKDVYADFGIPDDLGWSDLTLHSAIRQENGTYALHYDPAIGDVFTEDMADVKLWDVWDNVRCPTLVLRGENSDVLTRETAERMTRSGPKAELVELPGVGHAPALMTEDQIKVVHDWLRSFDEEDEEDSATDAG